MMRKWIAGAFALLMIVGAGMIWSGTIRLHEPSQTEYPVRGVDVSHWQGEIDWEELAAQGIDFAFIKATEGSGYVDECFEKNWADAQKTALRVGAYHFFSFDSSGEAQAENFMRNVPIFEDMLPPVIDVEFYGDKAKNPPEKQDVCRELNALIMKLKEYTGKTSILYATQAAYRRYLAGDFELCDIWIRDVIGVPKLADGREWTFWQYTDRGTLAGYSGEEKYIDVNVFNGTAAEFAGYGMK